MRSIVIPTYNEESRIGAAIKALSELKDSEIIISDDGSTDGTVVIARKHSRKNGNIKVLEGAHRGKGAALIAGFNACGGSVMGFLDADMSAAPEELLKLFELVENDVADLAIGSREVPGAVLPVRQPVYRRSLGRLYSMISRVLFKVDVVDFQCGCKAFKRELWEAAGVVEEGFVFDTELIARASSLGFRIKEVPITWRNDRRSKVNPLKDSVRMFISLIRIKMRMGR